MLPDCRCICCRQPLPGSWRASAARPLGATSAVTSFVPCAWGMRELSEVCRLIMWIGGYGDIVCKQFKLCYRLSRTTIHSGVWYSSSTSSSCLRPPRMRFCNMYKDTQSVVCDAQSTRGLQLSDRVLPLRLSPHLARHGFPCCHSLGCCRQSLGLA